MANTFVPIQSITLSGTQASVTFSSIPQTYTDLMIRYTARTARASAADSINLTVNAITSGYSEIDLSAVGTVVASTRYSAQASLLGLECCGDTAAANTFASGEIFFPNYAGSTYKSVMSTSVAEDNLATGYIYTHAGLLSNTVAIASITLTGALASFKAGCAFHLYGIKNS